MPVSSFHLVCGVNPFGGKCRNLHHNTYKKNDNSSQLLNAIEQLKPQQKPKEVCDYELNGLTHSGQNATNGRKYSGCSAFLESAKLHSPTLPRSISTRSVR